MNMKVTHDERRYGDTVQCAKCGKQWDVDDLDPPECVTDQDRINEIRAKFNFTKDKK